MKLHIALRPLPVLYLSKGLETELSNNPNGHVFRVITVWQMSEGGCKSRAFAKGAVEFETYHAEWLNGWVLTISPLTQLARFIDTMK